MIETIDLLDVVQQNAENTINKLTALLDNKESRTKINIIRELLNNVDIDKIEKTQYYNEITRRYVDAFDEFITVLTDCQKVIKK